MTLVAQGDPWGGAKIEIKRPQHIDDPSRAEVILRPADCLLVGAQGHSRLTLYWPRIASS